MSDAFTGPPTHHAPVSGVGFKADRITVGPHFWHVYILRATERMHQELRIRLWTPLPQENLLYQPRFYTGMSQDPARRLIEHNAGKCSATKGHTWYLFCGVAHLSAQDARMLEVWFKTGDTTIKRNHLLNFCLRNRIDFADWGHYRSNLDATMGFVAWERKTYPRIQARRQIAVNRGTP